VGADSISIIAPPAVDAGPLGAGTFSIDTTTAAIQLFASGGAHVVGNAINYINTNAGTPLIINGTNNLTLSGAIDLSGTNRAFQIDNTANTVLSGVITDDGNVFGLTKTGAGVLYLDGANTYTGETTNNAGTLAGSGSLAGPVIVQSGGTIGGGDAGSIPGTFTISSDLTLNGNVAIRLNKSQAQSNDVITVTGTLVNSGTGSVIVTNVGPALVVGDKFTLFNQPVSGGTALTVTGGYANWLNHLAADGSIQVQSLISPIAPYSTNITASVSGSTLTITWPATHLGWLLQSQTNALNTGLSPVAGNWHDLAGTDSATQKIITVNPANPTVFYRLRHP